MNERWVQRINLKPIKPCVRLLLQKSCYFNDEFIFKAVPILLRGIPPLTAAQCALQCWAFSPTCSLWNSMDFPELSLCQAGWAAEETSSTCSHLSVSECTTNPCKMGKATCGATQPHGKATDSLSPCNGPSWTFYGWSVNLTWLLHCLVQK